MSQLDSLWEYQQIDLELTRLNKELRSSPAYQKRSRLHKVLVEQKEKLAGYEATLQEHAELIASLEEQLAACLHDYELELSELDSMENDEETTSQEVVEARKSIERLSARVNSLTRELNKLSAWCTEITEAVTKTYAEGGRAKRDYDALRTACDAEKESYQPKIDALTKELEEKKAAIPPELLKRYERIKKNYPEPIAKVINGQCSGCHMGLSSVAEKRVAAGIAIVTCENCGRLLII